MLKNILFIFLMTYSNLSHSGMLPFHIAQDALSGITAAKLNEPITDRHAIHVNGEHFYTVGPDLRANTPDDQRVRFWGINLSPPMVFPINQKESERLASRLEVLGFNLVRLHALDMVPKKTFMSVFEKTTKSYPVLNKKNIKALKMLVNSLKKHGIYIDLVLKLGYTFNSDKDCIYINKKKQCVPSPDVTTNKYKTPGKIPSNSKPLDLFNHEMIELQKKYFSLIIDHFKNDPVLAMVEISNENSLIETFTKNDKRIPPLYAEELDGLWTKWLENKYGSVAKLKSVWSRSKYGINTKELLKNTDFKVKKGRYPENWLLTQWALNGDSHWGRWQVTKNDVLKINIDRIPEKYWYMFITQQGQQIYEGDLYSINIRAKSNPPRTIQIGVNAEVNGKTVQANRFKQNLQLTSDYKNYSICFKSTINNKNSRITILPIQKNSVPGELWIDKISFSKAKPKIDLNMKFTRFEEFSRPNVTSKNMCPESQEKELDYLKFLVDTEKNYYENMKLYINQEIGLKVPITGTQANYGGLLGSKIISDVMDYADVHYYWDHTKTKNRDIENWWMENKSMVDNLNDSLFHTIASTRINNMPYTISEYGMNLVNEYAHEGFVLGAAYGAYQDIDAIIVFDYNAGGSGTDSRKRMQPDRLTNWYNILGDARSEVLMPVAAAIFRNTHLIGSAQERILNVDNDTRYKPILNGVSIRNHYKILSDKTYFSNGLPVNYADYLKNKYSIKHINDKGNIPSNNRLTLTAKNKTEPQTINISYNDKKYNYVKVITPNIGFVSGYVGKDVEIGKLQLVSKGNNRKYCTITVSSIDGKSLNETNSMLIRTVGKGNNKKTNIVKTQNGYRSCVTDREKKCIKPFYHPVAGKFVVDSCSINVSVNNKQNKIQLETLGSNGKVINIRDVTRKNGKLNINLDNGDMHSLWHLLHLQ
ncbi:MAG: beta-galactosidase [Pseudomonadota bacterium]